MAFYRPYNIVEPYGLITGHGIWALPYGGQTAECERGGGAQSRPKTSLIRARDNSVCVQSLGKECLYMHFLLNINWYQSISIHVQRN